MVVNTVSADQVRGNGRSRFIAPQPNTHYNNPNGNRNRNHTAHPRYQCRAIQTTPAWDLATDVMGVDLEGCERDRLHYVGKEKKVVYDTFADDGGFKTPQQFIKKLPPKPKNLGVDWQDMYPWNGARPIREVIENAIQLMVGRTIVFHSAGNDVRMLDHSAEMCGLAIPWDRITLRDTQRFVGWQYLAAGSSGPSLRTCAANLLHLPNFQGSGHTSRDDAKATIELYLLEQAAIERQYASNATEMAILTSLDIDEAAEPESSPDGQSPSSSGVAYGGSDSDTPATTATGTPSPDTPGRAYAQVLTAAIPTLKLGAAVVSSASQAPNTGNSIATPSTAAVAVNVRVEKPAPPRSWAQVAKVVAVPSKAAQQQAPGVFRKRAG